MAHEAIAEYVTDVLTTFSRLLRSIIEQTHGNMESICFFFITKKKLPQKSFFFVSEPLNMTRKPALAHSAHFGKKKAL